MLFEPDLAYLRYIRYGDREVLRAINAPFRDHNWGTVLPQLTSLALKEEKGGFLLTFEVQCRGGEIAFDWTGEIAGASDGTVTFTFDGVARTSFWRNRIGFCVLHPIRECKGAPCRIETVDGKVMEGTFPEAISPHQPFKNLKAIAHRVAGDVWARVAFEGDVFEMEDQRNWTDASFKTYCTPLELPFPVRVEEGERIRQRVTLTLEGKQGPPEPKRIAIAGNREAGVVRVEIGDDRSPMPPVGLQLAAGEGIPTGIAAERLRALKLSHLRLDVPFHQGDWEECTERGVAAAIEVGAPLEVALVLTEGALASGGALERALDLLQAADVVRLCVFHQNEASTSAKWVHAVRERLRGRLKGCPVGGGANAYFAELNRGRPPADAVDFVTYSINPQVHAFDDASIVETLEAQGETVSGARSFSGGKPVIVSPVTLKPRFNPNPVDIDADAGEDERFTVDPRQRTTFAAGWAAASIGRLAQAGAAGLTYFETMGERGVMERDVFPVYHVFAAYGAMRGGAVLGLRSAQPSAVDGLALERDGQVTALLANFTRKPQCVRLVCSAFSKYVRVKLLSQDAKDPLQEPESFQARTGLMQEADGGGMLLAVPPRALVTVTSGPEQIG